MSITENKIQELRELDILPVAQHYLQDLKKQGSSWKCKSPFSNEKTPSFTIISNATDNFFKCFSTGKSGDVIEFVKEVNNLSFIDACKELANLSGIDLELKNNFNSQQMPHQKPIVKKPIVKKSLLSHQKEASIQSYQKPNIIQHEPNKSVLDVFLSRSISEQTVKQFKITQSDTYFAQIGEKAQSINFNYYKNNQLVNVKHRAVDKKAFGLEKGCELVLYNLDNVEKDKDYIFITEGEFDALALGEFYQSPKNILSVPNGASTGRKQNLTYLDNNVFDGKKLYLLFDDDRAGKLLTDAFISRFGSHRCLVPTYPKGCKDLNDVLITYGNDGVATTLESFKYPNITGITDVRDFEHKIWDYWENGYPKGDRVGLQGLDPLLSFRGGELTMVTGISGSGKSEFLDYIMVELSKQHDWKWAVCSMENPGDIHTTKIIEKYLKANLTDIYDSETGEIFYHKADREQIKEALAFSYNYFNYIEHATTLKDGEKHRSVLSIDYILDQAKKLVSMYGTKGLVIDPWNTIEHDIKNNELETNYVSRILSKIIAFAEDYNVHVFLVAHPTKGVTINGVDRVATLNDISGSGNFFNKTHNGISVFREKDKDKNPDNLVEVHVQKVKFKFVGTLGSCKLEYDLRTGNYFDTDKDYPHNNN